MAFFDYGASGNSSHDLVSSQVNTPYFSTVEGSEDCWFVLPSSLEAHTRPPHTQSLSKLFVLSKHSLVPGVLGVPENHFNDGKRWGHHILERAGNMTERLAGTPPAKHWTIAAEKHDLRYPDDKTGLYLSNITDCSQRFRMQPTIILDAFTRKLGLIPIPLCMTSGHSWTRSAAAARHVEQRGAQELGRTHDRLLVVGPRFRLPLLHADGSSFFFKYQFDRLYL
ncbi:hypothetical protein EI94DRAFT_1789020, partial [Lactarius quietus]